VAHPLYQDVPGSHSNILSSLMMKICNLRRRELSSALRSRRSSKLLAHLLNHVLDTNSTFLGASRLTCHTHSHSIPFFHWPGTTAGTATGFSSSHIHALALLEERGDASNAMTWGAMKLFGRLLRGLPMGYTRTRHLYTMVLVGLLTLYTGRHKQWNLFAFVVSMT